MKESMTSGRPARSLLLFALPIVLGNIFQQFYNIIDSMVVGNFVGEQALAAVGASYAVTQLFIAIATGAGIGCSVIISQLYGAGQMERMKSAVSTALLATGALSLGLTGVGFLSSSGLLELMRTPGDIYGQAQTYLNIYFLGAVFLFLYNILTSVFNALGESRIPLIFLLVSSLVNIVLDLWFVAGLGWGVAGAAWATLIAQGVSCLLSFWVLRRRLAAIPAKAPYPRFSGDLLSKMCRVAVPSTVQQSVVSVGMFLVQAVVNGFGSSVIAGYTAAIKIDSICILPMVSMGNAVSTFTAQNIGAGQMERVRAGLRISMGVIAAISLPVTLALYLFGDRLVGLFLDAQSGGAAIAAGVEYLRVVSVFYIAMGAMKVAASVLRGAGDIFYFMLATMANLGVRVALAYALSPVLGASAVWWAIPAGWAVGFAIAFLRYRTGRWRERRLI